MKVFEDNLRLRVCGICVHQEKILLVKHNLNGKAFWSPPGGGLQFGENVSECLHREFLEETGLEINVEELMFVHEYLHKPLHAIELFFKVNIKAGTLIIGKDPELLLEEQLIQDVAFLPMSEILEGDKSNFHQIFSKVHSLNDIFLLKGYFRL